MRGVGVVHALRYLLAALTGKPAIINWQCLSWLIARSSEHFLISTLLLVKK